MQARVVKMKDDRLGNVQLDVNNGWVYDQHGNQIAKWAVTDQKHSKALADHAANEMLDVVARAAASGVSLDGSMPREAFVDAAKTIRMRGWDDARTSQLVQMDLGQSDVHQATPLPNYAAGYKNDVPLADIYSPPILVNVPSAKYYTFAKEDAFQRAMPSIGATSAQVNEIAPRLENAQFAVTEYALGGFVGTQLESAADAPLKIRRATVDRVLNALLLERELRVAALAMASGTWDSTVYTALAAAAKWNGGLSSNPIKDFQDRIETSWGTPTGAIMSRRTFHAFQRNPAVLQYYVYKDSAKPMPDAAQMSALLQLPPIYVSDMKYIKSDGTLAYVWGNNVVLFRIPPQMPPTSQTDISSAITFRWRNAGITDGGVGAGGMTVREFFLQDRGSGGGNKVVVIHADAEVQTSVYLGGLIGAAYA